MSQERISAAEFRRRTGAEPTVANGKPQIKSHANPTDPKLQSAKPERHQKAALDKTAEGKTVGLPRTTVRFIGYRVRPLDPDNFAGGCKDLLDGLRHASIIQGDEPWRIILETEQIKADHYAEEKTIIEIDIPTAS